MKTVREFTYLCDRVRASGGYEVAESARRRCVWLKVEECGELLHEKMFPLRLKRAFYKSYVGPTILYESEAWCMKESEMGFLLLKERLFVRSMCVVQLKYRKKTEDLMPMLGLNE